MKWSGFSQAERRKGEMCKVVVARLCAEFYRVERKDLSEATDLAAPG